MPIDPSELTKSIGALGTLDPEAAWPPPFNRLSSGQSSCSRRMRPG
jgi:hypothetical protein